MEEFKTADNLMSKEDSETEKDLVDQYITINQTLNSLQKRQDELKNQLLTKSQSLGRKKLQGTNKSIYVNTIETLSLPKKHTPQYEQLIQTIKSIGKLDLVTSFDTTQLKVIIRNKKWDAETLNILERFVKRKNTPVVKMGSQVLGMR